MADSPADGLKKALADLGIERIVCVDDMYAASIDVPTLVVWGTQVANKQAAQGVLKAHNVTVDLEAETVEAELRKALEESRELAASFQSARDSQLLKSEPTDTPENAAQEFVDRIVLGRLDELLVGFADFKRYGPADWATNRQALVNEMGAHKTLFIFDESLGDNYDKGTEFIRSLATSAEGGAGYYVLLSYTIAQGTEHERTREFQHDNIAATAIPKRDLTEPASIEFLYVRLRAAIMWRESANLRKACVKAMKAALKPAHERIHDLTPLEFDEVIFRSSFSEGVHELDTLVRVYTNAFASQLRERLRKDRSAINEVGDLRKYRATEKIASVGSTAWKLQREEIYDSGAYVNECGMPLEAGDVFKMTSAAGAELGEFVLLAQPCDLIVRSRDNAAGKRKIECTLLAPIANREPAKNEKSVFALSCYCPDTGKTSIVDMSKAVSIDLRLLDLCVLNVDGVARIKLDGKTLKSMSVGWDVRLKNELVPFAEEVVKAWHDWNLKPVSDRIVGAELPSFCIPFTGRHLLQTTVVKPRKVATLTFGVQRTQRLSTSLAAELLQAYGDHLSRPARPHSLSLSSGIPS